MAQQPKYTDSCSMKVAKSMTTPSRKLRQPTSPPKMNQTRPVYSTRVGPLLPSFDDWTDEELKSLEPVKPWSRSA